MAVSVEALKSLLVESIRGICSSNVGFDNQLKIEGLLAVSVDADKVMVISVAETMHEEAHASPSPLPDVPINSFDCTESKPLVAMQSFRSPFKRQRGRRRYASANNSRLKRSHDEMISSDIPNPMEKIAENTSPVMPVAKETPDKSDGCLSGGKLISSIAADLKSCLTPTSHDKHPFPLTSTPTDTDHPQDDALDLKVKRVRFESYNITPSVSPTKCHVCSQAQKPKGNVDVHVQRHYGLNQNLCEHCGVDLSSSTDVKGHRWKDLNIKEFKCAECGSDFSYQINLKRHMQKKHPDRLAEQLSPE